MQSYLELMLHHFFTTAYVLEQIAHTTMNMSYSVENISQIACELRYRE